MPCAGSRRLVRWARARRRAPSCACRSFQNLRCELSEGPGETEIGVFFADARVAEEHLRRRDRDLVLRREVKMLVEANDGLGIVDAALDFRKFRRDARRERLRILLSAFTKIVLLGERPLEHLTRRLRAEDRAAENARAG